MIRTPLAYASEAKSVGPAGSDELTQRPAIGMFRGVDARFLPRFFHEPVIAQQVADAQRWQA